ncbi:sulfur carrier protein ThiS adenylyltransferase ThiF [Desulfonatronum thioautotrophicum]|uniref:sulfur carrier protein ThiS adenylyltransferase ThiF n=1 Tax=Desulfonatronum thioautotrophicum TaxID=617001 RepID=UPI0005EB83BF|nr:sulfur carrier protein ThiS adenylyltransferase ThiF [Desulfonatronum thioautotrophicum]
MNITEQGIARHIGPETLVRLQQVRIGLAGAGGLGSNCAQALVRSGFKRFVLVDFDRVEPSNLNRQFFFPDQVGLPKVVALGANLLRINPDLELKLHETAITLDNVHPFFAGCDAMLECVDDPAVKKLLAEAMLPTATLFVAASGIAGCGNTDRIRTRRLRSNFFLVGDEQTTACSDTPPLAPLVTLAAAKQADVVLHHFLHQHEQGAHAGAPLRKCIDRPWTVEP